MTDVRFLPPAAKFIKKLKDKKLKMLYQERICSANSPPVLVLDGRITSSFPRTVHSASVSNPSMVKNFSETGHISYEDVFGTEDEE